MRWQWEPNWADLLTGGPGVARVMDAAGEVVEQGATRRAPVAPPEPGEVSGELRASVRRVPGRDGTGPYMDVRADSTHALAVERGTRPHLIRSRGPWPLRNRATGQVFGPVVHHPGTRAQPFLESALDDLVGRVWR